MRQRKKVLKQIWKKLSRRLLWALSDALLLAACVVLFAPARTAAQPLGPAVAQLSAGETNPPAASFNPTQGRKKLLYIRVAYPDDPTEPVTEAQAYTFMNQDIK